MKSELSIQTKLKNVPRHGRTAEQLLNHYMVESSIARKLMNAPRAERSAIYLSMYDELFDKVPDHPRLNIRNNEELSKRSTSNKLKLVNSLLKDTTTFVEFAPGDCRFAICVAQRAKKIYGIDISEQHHQEMFPHNFELIIYDGYTLAEVPANSVDVVFSDQLVEHIHPEDVEHHFSMVKKMLNKNGVYVMRTPHKSSGPHDVSVYFSDVPLGFHLKEWNYSEIKALSQKVGFEIMKTYWFAKGFKCRLPNYYFLLIEKLFALLPNNVSRKISKYFIPSVCCVFQVSKSEKR